eukprot:CAMPEP_0184688576 /NCGR_PEP_ID=MMETSP0312-20130426/30175_1 /TAXON_ID=31354 /ORGANISM="Compsopogon coeruleus, Strain SAG 36.94" /LENGTH=471 /DNA_ID=CAMNT_0027145827 /DNA_START=120 /DNA_END=1535 /DNA_ORIENTATION=+
MVRLLNGCFGGNRVSTSSAAIPRTAFKTHPVQTTKSPAKVKIENEEFQAHVSKVSSIKASLLVLMESIRIYERDWKDLYVAQKAWSEAFEAKYVDTDAFSELLRKTHHHMVALDKLYDVRVKGEGGKNYRRMNDELLKYLGELNAIEAAYAPLELKQKEVDRERKHLERYEKGLSKEQTTVDNTTVKLETLRHSMEILSEDKEKEKEKVQYKVDRQSAHLEKYTADLKEKQEKVEKTREGLEEIQRDLEKGLDDLLARMKTADEKKEVIFRLGIAGAWLGFADYAEGMRNQCNDHFAMANGCKDGFVAMNLQDVTAYDHPSITFKNEVIKPPSKPDVPPTAPKATASVPNPAPTPASSPPPVVFPPAPVYSAPPQANYQAGPPQPQYAPYGAPPQGYYPPAPYYASQAQDPRAAPQYQAAPYGAPRQPNMVPQPLPQSSPVTEAGTPNTESRVDIYESTDQTYLKPAAHAV